MAIEDIKNFREVDELLGTAGQPSESQLREIALAGYEVVINLGLLDPRYCLPDEAGLVSGLGMEYHHIPVVFGSPRVADFERFVEVMKSCRGRKTFVHCALNWRVSAFVGLYGEMRLGWSRMTADTHMRTFWEPDEAWKDLAAQCRAKPGATER
jgi:protein tyrosine phosphatase (PTP) superfamily phosphohydrolase (DUF442 family)